MNIADNCRLKLVAAEVFHTIRKNFLRFLVYGLLVYKLVGSLLYINNITVNIGIQEKVFKNLAGATFMGYDQGDVYFNYYPPALYYEELKKTYGEGNYAIAPFLVKLYNGTGGFMGDDVARTKDDINLFYMDQTSYDIFDWSLKDGVGFSNNPNEVIAIGDSAKVGDVITYRFEWGTRNLTVVGVFDLEYYPMRYQRGIYATNAFAYFKQYRDRNFVSGNVYNAYLLNPIVFNEDNMYRNVDNVSGAYVKKEAIEQVGDNANHRYCIPSKQVGGWFGDWSEADNYRWITICAIEIGVVLLLLIIYTIWEINSRYKKERTIYIMWNRCGMDTDVVRGSLANAHVWPMVIGFVAALVVYLFTYMSVAGHLWNFVVIAFCIGLYLSFKLLIINKLFNKHVQLRSHGEGVFDLASIDSDFVMDPDKTVRKNLSIPATFEATNEKGIEILVDRMLGIGCVHTVSELKYRHLSEYEKFKARFARAFMVVPDVLFVGKEYKALTDKQRTEMDRLFDKVKNNWNVQIEFTDR